MQWLQVRILDGRAFRQMQCILKGGQVCECIGYHALVDGVDWGCKLFDNFFVQLPHDLSYYIGCFLMQFWQLKIKMVFKSVANQ